MHTDEPSAAINARIAGRNFPQIPSKNPSASTNHNSINQSLKFIAPA